MNNPRTKSSRSKVFTSGRVILLSLVLVGILWTTEWMDRLQGFSRSFGGEDSPSSMTTSKPSHLDTTPISRPEDEPVYDPVDHRGAETLAKVEIDVPEQKDPTPDERDTPPTTGKNDKVLNICVVSSNPRTASLFHSKTLRRKGNGKFDYTVTTKKCPADASVAPVTVKMLYQKSISGYSPAQLNALFDDPRNLVIVMGDEFCRCPVEICSYRAHARQYYSQSYVDYVTQHPSLDGNPTVYLPLGPRIEFPQVLDEEIIPSSERKLLFNLIVSPTSPARKRLAAMVAKEKFDPVFVHVTPAFAGNASEAKGFVAPEEYRKTLLDAKFTLCPAGHNPEAFRLYEACEAGSIPVVVKDEEDSEHVCKDSFAPLLASGAPFLVLNNWDELGAALKPFLDDPALLDERQRKLKLWYARFWGEVSRDFECSITQNIEQILKSGPSSRLTSLDGYEMPECGDDEEEKDDELNLQSSKEVAQQPVVETTKQVEPTPLIVGCGRTGTLSLSRYLVKNAGIKSIHEKMEPFSVSVSWLYAVPDAAQYPFEGKKSPSFRRWKQRALKKVNRPLFSPVVHVVRHPLKVISSTRRCFCGRGTRSTGLGQASDAKSWQFVDQNIKMPKPNLPLDSLLRSMTYWYEWNVMIPKKHSVAQRFRIEDLDPNQLVRSLGVQLAEGTALPNRVPRAPSHVSPDEERELLPDATWADLNKEDAALAQKIFRLAQEYGYEPKAEKLEDLL